MGSDPVRICWGCGNEVRMHHEGLLANYEIPARDDDTSPCCDYEIWHGERDEQMLAPLQTEEAGHGQG